jgi:hypothetical protein
MPIGGLSVKHRIFVSYHHRGDQTYYDYFSRVFHDQYELIYDNSMERAVDSDNVDYVMRQIREKYLTGTSCTMVLVGAATWGRKYVDWEISATLDKQHALIGFQLPTAVGGNIPDRLFDNIKSGFSPWLSWQEIMNNPPLLPYYIQDAKSRNLNLADNHRALRLRNA